MGSLACTALSGVTAEQQQINFVGISCQHSTDNISVELSGFWSACMSASTEQEGCSCDLKERKEVKELQTSWIS